VSAALQGVVYGRERTGPESSVRLQLQRVLGAYMREGRWKHVKIGIACDPERRWRQAYRDYGWQALVCVYCSNSWSSVGAVEDFLIKYAHASFIGPGDDEATVPLRNSQAGFYLYNETSGGGGRVPDADPPYYVYFALAPLYARIRKK